MQATEPSWRVDFISYVFYYRRQDFISPDSRFRNWVMIVTDEGEYEFSSRGRGGVVGPGAFGLVAPREPFDRRGTQAPLSYHTLQFDFRHEDGRLWEDAWTSGRYEIADTRRLNTLLPILKNLAGQGDAYARGRALHLLEDVLWMAWETLHRPAATRDPLMLEAARLLRERAGSALSMRDISSELGLGPVQFTRRFRAAHGINPVEFLTARRIEIAQHLLIGTDLNLEAIARHCGWATGYYLSHVFSRSMGISPGQFRRLHRVD